MNTGNHEVSEKVSEVSEVLEVSVRLLVFSDPPRVRVIEPVATKLLRSKDKEEGYAQEERESFAVVYDHWRQARGKTSGWYDKISPARKGKIVSRLKEFSVNELLCAIDAVALDPWDGRSNQDDLTIIFRSREQVEKFLDFASSAPKEIDYPEYRGLS